MLIVAVSRSGPDACLNALQPLPAQVGGEAEVPRHAEGRGGHVGAVDVGDEVDDDDEWWSSPRGVVRLEGWF
jgi:hypothetical protein